MNPMKLDDDDFTLFGLAPKQALDRSEGAVKQLQLRAIENLRAQMEAAHA